MQNKKAAMTTTASNGIQETLSMAGTQLLDSQIAVFDAKMSQEKCAQYGWLDDNVGPFIVSFRIHKTTYNRSLFVGNDT